MANCDKRLQQREKQFIYGCNKCNCGLFIDKMAMEMARDDIPSPKQKQTKSGPPMSINPV